MPATEQRPPHGPGPGPGRTTLLMYACSQGDLAQVKRILHNQPSSARERDRTQKTALHYCAGGAGPNAHYPPVAAGRDVVQPALLGGGGGLAQCADVLVMAAPGLVDARDEDGFTPLHLAVIAGNVQLVQFLLANGADVNALDAEKHSVVHWATVCGETAALNAVLAAGATVSSPDVHGGYPLHYAAQMCGSEKSELGLQVLHILLAQASISVSVEDNEGRGPLLWAASAGSARAVLALVRAGAAVEAADRDGLTALHCAASRGHTDTLDTLLTLCGAAPDVIDTNGCTALHYSVTLGHADATALLLSHGADPNRQDRKGRSPAHCGCAKGRLETVRQLGARGANLWLRNARGDLPLHEAAASARRPLVRWLLDQRPSQVNARNNDGRCPLHLAALNDNADMCKILLDAGAQVNPVLRTSKNVFMTPLDCALQRGFRSTAKFLQLHGGVPANRLGTVRVGSEITANIGSASNIHIREDITVKGGSSSESDLEDSQRKDSRPKKRTIRRRVAYRHDKTRDHSVSGSEHETDKKLHGRRDKSGSRTRDATRKTQVEEETRVKGRDVDVLRKDGDGRTVKTVKQIEVRSDGKQFRKKRLEIESQTETDITSPETNNNKYRRDKISTKSNLVKNKTGTASQKQDFLEAERQKQNYEDSNDSISDSESKKTTLERDRRKKKSRADTESLDMSDVEPTKKVASDRERSKPKPTRRDDNDSDVEASRKSDHNRKKQRKLRDDYSDEEISDERQAKSRSKQRIEEESEEEHTKRSKSKISKDEISEADYQKQRISDVAHRKKQSADSERKRDRSSGKRCVQKRDSTDTEQEKKKEERDKRKSASKSRDSSRSERRKEKPSVVEKEETLEEEKSRSITEDDSKVSKKRRSADRQKSESASSVKQRQQSSAKSSSEKENLEQSRAQQLESKQQLDEKSENTPKTLKAEEAKQIEDEIESPKLTIQPDQISLQSKLSEEFPSKTIVVEASVHQPPKGVEDDSLDETSPPTDAKNDIEKPSSSEESDKLQAIEQENGTSEDKTIGEGSFESDEKKVEDSQQTFEVTQEDQQTVEEVQQVVASIDDSTTATELKSQEVAASSCETGTVGEIKNITRDDTLVTEEKDDKSEETKMDAELMKPVETKEQVDAIETKVVVDEQNELINQIGVEEKNEEQESTTAEINTTKPEDSLAMSEHDLHKDETKLKPNELNIDLSLKKFEESANMQEATGTDEIDENSNNTTKDTQIEETTPTQDEAKPKKKKVKISKSKRDKNKEDTVLSNLADGTVLPTDLKLTDAGHTSSSTSRESSSSESDSEKSVKKADHKSFKVLHDDVAFEVLKDGTTTKEPRRMKRKSSKKNLKEVINESATSSPEMLESNRVRSKSLNREKDSNSVTFPALADSKRPDSNLSAPNLSSVYSDNEQKSGSNSEVDDVVSSASRKRRFKRRSKARLGSKSAGSDYESSNLIDSGFEPSPRSSRIPKRKVMSERGVNMSSVTQTIQSNIRKYHMERKIFQHLLDLKRLQIRSGQANEAVLVKRAIDAYHDSVAASVGAGRYKKKDFTYRSFEQFLYQSLRMLQKSPVDHLRGLPETTDNPLLCTQSTHRCLHATHAYTGIPCAAYIPKMNHHTIPKIGFNQSRASSSFLPQINAKGKSVTLELCHGNDKQVISLPADRLDHNKRYYVTFTVKGQESQSPSDQQDTTTTHRHAKSV